MKYINPDFTKNYQHFKNRFGYREIVALKTTDNPHIITICHRPEADNDVFYRPIPGLLDNKYWVRKLI